MAAQIAPAIHKGSLRARVRGNQPIPPGPSEQACGKQGQGHGQGLGRTCSPTHIHSHPLTPRPPSLPTTHRHCTFSAFLLLFLVLLPCSSPPWCPLFFVLRTLLSLLSVGPGPLPGPPLCALPSSCARLPASLDPHHLSLRFCAAASFSTASHLRCLLHSSSPPPSHLISLLSLQFLPGSLWPVRQTRFLRSHCRRYHRCSCRVGRHARCSSRPRCCHHNHLRGRSCRSDGSRCCCLLWPISLPQDLAGTGPRPLRPVSSAVPLLVPTFSSRHSCLLCPLPSCLRSSMLPFPWGGYHMPNWHLGMARSHSRCPGGSRPWAWLAAIRGARGCGGRTVLPPQGRHTRLGPRKAGGLLWGNPARSPLTGAPPALFPEILAVACCCARCCSLLLLAAARCCCLLLSAATACCCWLPLLAAATVLPAAASLLLAAAHRCWLILGRCSSHEGD